MGRRKRAYSEKRITNKKTRNVVAIPSPSNTDEDEPQPGPSSALASVRFSSKDTRIPKLATVMDFKTAHDTFIKAITVPPEEPTGSRQKKRKVQKVDWEPVIKAFQLEAGLRGIPLEDIENIWKLVNDSIDAQISISNKAALILCMIPQKKIPKQLVENMIDWLVQTSTESNNLTKLSTNLLIYFVGLVEYDLIDGNPFAEHYYYNILLCLRRHNITIPWVCHLLRLVTNSSHVSKSLVANFISFRQRDLNPFTSHVIDDLLRLYKAVNPKLFPKNYLKMRVIGKVHDLKFDQSLKRRMYEAQGRILGRPKMEVFIPSPRKSKRLSCALLEQGSPDEFVDFSQNAHDLFFPEFKPQDPFIGTANVYVGDLKKENKMHHFLLNEQCLQLMVEDPLILNRFYTWASLIFRHKFENYDPKQHNRYAFILDRCCVFTTLLNHSLPPIDEWLPYFLVDWDGILYREEILHLLRYISFLDFEDGWMYVFEKLEYLFLDGTLSEKLEIWKTLESLYIRWSTLIKTALLEEENQTSQKLVDIVKTLFRFMYQLVITYAAANGVGDDLLLFTFSATFEKFINRFPEVKPSPPLALWYMVLASNSIRMLDCFCKILKKMDELGMHKNKVFLECCMSILNKFESPLGQLFRSDVKLQKKFAASQVRNNNSKSSGSLTENSPGSKELFRGFNFAFFDYYGICLENQSESSKPVNGQVKMKLNKFKEDYPNVFYVLQAME